MAIMNRFVVKSGDGFLIDIIQGTPHLHTDCLDWQVHRYDSREEAEQARSQVEELGYQAEIVQLIIGTIDA